MKTSPHYRIYAPVNWVGIASGNGFFACLAPGHYPKQCCLILNWTLGNNLQWNSNRNDNRFIHQNALESVVCEMVGICPGEDELICISAYKRYIWYDIPKQVFPYIWNIFVYLASSSESIYIVYRHFISQHLHKMKQFDTWFSLYHMELKYQCRK